MFKCLQHTHLPISTDFLLICSTSNVCTHTLRFRKASDVLRQVNKWPLCPKSLTVILYICEWSEQEQFSRGSVCVCVFDLNTHWAAFTCHIVQHQIHFLLLSSLFGLIFSQKETHCSAFPWLLSSNLNGWNIYIWWGFVGKNKIWTQLAFLTSCIAAKMERPLLKSGVNA